MFAKSELYTAHVVVSDDHTKAAQVGADEDKQHWTYGLMGWFAQMFSGVLIGIVAVALIAIFALGRSLCSITHKDLLGKTVDKGRRGSVSGTAGTIAAVVTLLMAVGYSIGWIPLTVPVVAGMVALGGSCWPRSSSDGSRRARGDGRWHRRPGRGRRATRPAAQRRARGMKLAFG